MLGFMKTLVKIAFFGLLASTLPLPSMAESAFAGLATKGSSVTAKLNFSIVILPSLLLRVRTATLPGTTDTSANVRVEANGGSVSVLSTGAEPASIENHATTLTANRKLVRAESAWNHGVHNGTMTAVSTKGTLVQRRDQFTYTVAQL